MWTFCRGWAIIALVMGATAHGQDGKKPDPDEPVPGLLGEYHPIEGGVQDFYDLLVLPEPRVRRVDAKIEFKATADGVGGADLRGTLYVRWTGTLRVPREGMYTFSTESDDGSRLYIGGVKVVSNGGRHGMTEESGQARLKAGPYRFRLEYFNSSGAGGCIARWKGPGIEKQVIPEGVLFHRKSRALDVAAPKPAPRKGESGDAPIVIDTRVVRPGDPVPGIVGRVVSVFSDGITTMMTLRIPAGESRPRSVEVPVFIRDQAEVKFVDLPQDVKRAAKGMVAYVWLREGSKDEAARVEFVPDRK